MNRAERIAARKEELLELQRRGHVHVLELAKIRKRALAIEASIRALQSGRKPPRPRVHDDLVVDEVLAGDDVDVVALPRPRRKSAREILNEREARGEGPRRRRRA